METGDTPKTIRGLWPREIWEATPRQGKLSMRSFLKSQASDPILAKASEPLHMMVPAIKGGK